MGFILFKIALILEIFQSSSEITKNIDIGSLVKEYLSQGSCEES
jgi:hypothetical protein